MANQEVIDKLVPDTSVIIEGLVSQKIEKKEIIIKTLIIHEAVLAELEHQANINKTIGFYGLEEIQKIKSLTEKFNFNIEFMGKRPGSGEIKYARLGEIDAIIRELAYDEEATLITADKVQAKVAQAKGMKFIFLEIEQIKKKLLIESYFDKETMSAHLRENVCPYAKKGVPGNWQFTKIKNKELTREDIQEISKEIIEEAGVRKDSFIEIERPGSTIVQLGRYRVVVTRPPFSDGWEITAVRPIKQLNLEDYNLSEKLKQRVVKAEGILIAGSPGMGKTTFAQALAEFYAAQNKIVKTIEAPRDLILADNITQFAISHAHPQEINDILLLSRPDYTLFDEMRNTNDFRLFADLRLAGIGLAGVVHATNPIDAVQRFVGRIELGVIPQVVDTVIFIKDGKIDKVLSLQMVIKVPSGMTEADLARPVVVVTDFETKKLEYELYSYGEETVVIPVTSARKSPVQELAEKTVEKEFRKYTNNVEVEILSDNKVIVYVPDQAIAGIIGKEGRNISEIEKRLNIGIDIRELREKKEEKEEVKFNTQISQKNINFFLEGTMKGKDVDIYVGDDYLLTAKVGKSGVIKINKKNKIGKILLDAINIGEKVRLVV